MEHPAEYEHSRHLHGAHKLDGSLVCSGREEVSARAGAGAGAQGYAGATARYPQALLPAPRASAVPSFQERSLASPPLLLKWAPAVAWYPRTAHGNPLRPSLMPGPTDPAPPGPWGLLTSHWTSLCCLNTATRLLPETLR